MKNDNLKFKIWKHYIVLLALVVSVFILPSLVFSAELFFNAQNFEVKNGDLFETSLFLNSEDESVNAMEGRVNFSSDILKLRQIKDGNSIVNFWVEKPYEKQDIRDKRQVEVIFSGIIPGGYQKEKGFIFSLIFEAVKEGSGNIDVSNAIVLKNDGLGSKTDLKIKKFPVVVLENEEGIKSEDLKILSEEINYENDRNPPEEFKPEVAYLESIGQNKWFVVFSATDKESGVDYYEVKESRKFFPFFPNGGKWWKTESPYPLKDQKLKSFVYVKAVDKADNARVSSVAPLKLKWYDNYFIWIIIILITLAGTRTAFAVKKNKP